MRKTVERFALAGSVLCGLALLAVVGCEALKHGGAQALQDGAQAAGQAAASGSDWAGVGIAGAVTVLGSFLGYVLGVKKGGKKVT